MPYDIYALEQEDGVKLGKADIWKKRKASYESQGNRMNIIGHARTKDDSLDGVLKKFLIAAGLQVKIPNQASTEVYNLSVERARVLLNHIENGGIINDHNLRCILIGSMWKTNSMTIREFRSVYGTKYRVFSHQRPPTKSHIEDIKDYVMDTATTPMYIMPQMTATRVGTTYEIIDGNHRTEAFLLIPDDHPSLETTIEIRCHDIETTDADRLDMFRKFNNNLAMADVFIREDYILSLKDTVTRALQKKYGKRCIKIKNTKTATYDKIKADKISEWITRENIIQMIKQDTVKGINDVEFSQLLIELNDKIIEIINYFVGGYAILSDDSPVESIDNEVTDDHWLAAYKFYTDKINVGVKKPLVMKTFKSALESIRKTSRGKKSSPLKVKKLMSSKLKDPFTLGLIMNGVSLMDTITTVDIYYAHMIKMYGCRE